MGNLSINNGGVATNKGSMPSIDLRYGPYASVHAAHTALSDDDVVAVGLTVGIIDGNNIVEYWYQGGTSEANLVPKHQSSGPSFSGSYNDLTDRPSFATINNQRIDQGGNITVSGGGSSSVTIGERTFDSSALRNGYFWQSAQNVGSTMPKNAKYNAGFACMAIDVEPGDICEIRTKGGSSGRAYCLTDMFRVVQTVAPASANYLSSPATVTVSKKGRLYVSLDTSSASNAQNFSVIVRCDLSTKLELLRTQSEEALTPPPFKNGSLLPTTAPKILWLGNSFSENTLQYISAMISSLSNAPAYSVYLCKVSSTGLSYWAERCSAETSETVTPTLAAGQNLNLSSMTLAQLFNAQPWDVVMLQQLSTDAGNYGTYTPHLSKIIKTLKENCPNPNVAVVWEMIWSKQSTATGAQLDGEEYYNLIVDATKTMMRRDGINIIAPVGTAIQNARSGDIVDDSEFTADGQHLNALGQLIAGYTWFESVLGPLLGISIVNIAYKPSGIDDETLQEIKYHVMDAMANRFEISHSPT